MTVVASGIRYVLPARVRASATLASKTATAAGYGIVIVASGAGASLCGYSKYQ